MSRISVSRLAAAVAFACVLLGTASAPGVVQAAAELKPASASTNVSVGPQYDTTHVYVSNEDIDAFVNSFLATFGGKASPRAVFTVTPTPSKTASQYVQTPVGMLSVFAFQTPIPYPFGDERTGYLVTDIAATLAKAEAAGAKVLFTPYQTGKGKTSIVEFPGGYIAEIHDTAAQ